MTLKDFLKAWKECEKYDEQNKFNDELLEKYGVDMFEFDEIILELKDSNELKWWNEMLFDYFLEKAEKCDLVALAIKEKFRLDELDFIELRKLLQIMVLSVF